MAFLRFTLPVVALAGLLATQAVQAEDFFSLLEPEAFASQKTGRAAGQASVLISDDASAEEPAPPAALAAEPAVGPDPGKQSPTDPSDLTLTALVEAIPFEASMGPGLVMVSDELELVPAPTLAEPDLEPSDLPSTALTRSILGVSLDASADQRLVEQMAKIPDNLSIKDTAVERFGSWDAPSREATQTPPRFAGTLSNFAAPAVYSRPLYFEQPNLERYGHHVAFCDHDNLSQSALSAAHFFASVPVLPYMMGANPPGECNYVLGHYRPGSCNPHQLLKPRLSVGGGVAEGLAITGLIFLIP